MTDKFSWRAPDITPDEEEQVNEDIQHKEDLIDAADLLREMGFVPLGGSTGAVQVEEDRPCGRVEGKCCGGQCG